MYFRSKQYPHRQMNAREMIEAIFPGKQYGTKVPASVYANTIIDGVRVMYLTSADSQSRKEMKRGIVRAGMAMRALAFCPHCNRTFAASRLNQHAKVHKESK